MTGQLPFWQTAQLVAQGNTIIDSLPCSVWPDRSETPGSIGEVHTHVGEAPITYADELVDKPNRWLLIDGLRYKIVGAAAQPVIPHVQLELLRVNAAG